MEYYTILGVVVACLIAIIGVFATIKKTLKDEQKPMQDLNLNITRLTCAIENMQKDDGVRDDRIARHGNEIDELQRQVTIHDGKIKSLEDWRNKQ